MSVHGYLLYSSNTRLVNIITAQAEQRNHSTCINFSTQPCWLFGDADGDPLDYSHPNYCPDQSFFGYLRGSRSNILDPTPQRFGRLLFEIDIVSYQGGIYWWGRKSDSGGVPNTIWGDPRATFGSSSIRWTGNTNIRPNSIFMTTIRLCPKWNKPLVGWNTRQLSWELVEHPSFSLIHS